MVKKIKVVDVAPVEATEVPEVVEETEEVKPVEEAKEEEVVEEKPIAEVVKEIEIVKKDKPTMEYITCENCNKKVLMKTYKYSHQKVCKASNVPPPPSPPPPTPEPEPKKTKRVSKPKEKKEEQVEAPKPEFNGFVSFDHVKQVIDPYLAMRQERVLIRQQRVKSLISQAI